LRGHTHPRTAIASALLFVSTLANIFFQATLTIRTMSLFLSVAGKPARILCLTVHAFAFLLSILNVPRCSAPSPTCHMNVPYDTPIQRVQGMTLKHIRGKAPRIYSHAHHIGGMHPRHHFSRRAPTRPCWITWW
jgi:hypothetical protein